MLRHSFFGFLNPLFLQRYSVDPTSRADEVNIPLSTVEPSELPLDPVSHNGQPNIPDDI